MKEDSSTKIHDALLKKALGYDTEEVVSEYADSDDGIKLIKQKVTKKSVPPDVSALKMLLEENAVDYTALSDEELIKERERLISLLKENSADD